MVNVLKWVEKKSEELRGFFSKLYRWMQNSKTLFIFISLSIALLLLAVCSISISAASVSTESPTVIISDYQIYPEILMPGEIGILTMTITNTAEAGHAAKTEVRRVIQTHPLITTEEEEKRVTPLNARVRSIAFREDGFKAINGWHLHVGEIGPGQSMNFSFEIKAPVKDGIYRPKVLIDLDGGRDLRYPITMIVDSATLRLSADIPPVISVNETTVIELSIANPRQNQVSSVQIIPMADGIAIAPTDHFVGTMGPGDIKDISFELFSDQAGIKELYFEMIFRNGYNIHTREISFLVEVIDHPSIRITQVKHQLTVRPGEIAVIELEVMNARMTEVACVRVIPVRDTNMLITPAEAFVGAMEPGEIFTGRFEIDAAYLIPGLELEEDDKFRLRRMQFHVDTAGLPAGLHNIGFMAVYRDADGRLFESEVQVVRFRVVEPPILPIAIALILAGIAILVGYILYRQKRERDLERFRDAEIDLFEEDNK